MKVERITLLDGKYEVILEIAPGHFRLHSTRCGEPYREFIGDNIVQAMFDRIIDLEEELRKVKGE